MSDEFKDAALVLIGHGSTLNADSAAPTWQHADELRKRNLFAQVREAFWKQEPYVWQVLRGVFAARVFAVPLFISEGYFTEEVLPRELGFLETREGEKSGPGSATVSVALAGVPPASRAENEGPPLSADPRATKVFGETPKTASETLALPKPMFARVQKRGDQTFYYCGPIGTHPGMTEVLLARAKDIVDKFPFPRAPRPSDTALFIAGHGTGNNENSRKAIEQQADLIRARNIYAEVHAVFMEEDPRIGDCCRLAKTKNIVMVPFFISDGLHSYEDIPVMLGAPERVVRERLAQGQPTWRNPTERDGKRIWYTASIGNEPLVCEVILQRVREAAGR